MAINETITIKNVEILFYLELTEKVGQQASLLQSGLMASRRLVSPELLPSTELGQRIRSTLFPNITDPNEAFSEVANYLLPLYSKYYIDLMFWIVALLVLERNFIRNARTGEIRIEGLDMMIEPDYWEKPDFSLYDNGLQPRPPIRNPHHPYEKQVAYVYALCQKYPIVAQKLKQIIASNNITEAVVTKINQVKTAEEKGEAVPTEATFPNGEGVLDGNSSLAIVTPDKKPKRKSRISH